MDAAVARVIDPNWMPTPERWVWRRPDNHGQGFGAKWREHVGLSNLLWLACALENPPRVFDANKLTLYTLIVLHHNGDLRALVELAEVNTLASFAEKLVARPTLAKVQGYSLAPQMLTLIKERMRHAITR